MRSARPTPARTTGVAPRPGSATRAHGSSSSGWRPRRTARTAPAACSPATARATSCSPACTASVSPRSPRAGTPGTACGCGRVDRRCGPLRAARQPADPGRARRVPALDRARTRAAAGRAPRPVPRRLRVGRGAAPARPRPGFAPPARARVSATTSSGSRATWAARRCSGASTPASRTRSPGGSRRRCWTGCSSERFATAREGAYDREPVSGIESQRSYLRLTELLGAPVRDGSGRRIGRVADLVVSLDDTFPPVTGVLVRARRGTDPRVVPVAAVQAIGAEGVVLAGPLAPGDEVADDLLLLGRDVLDVQVVDAASRRIARVGDVDLATERGALRLFAVDVGWRAILRRLGLHALARRASRDALDWAGLHLAGGQGHPLPARRARRRRPPPRRRRPRRAARAAPGHARRGGPGDRRVRPRRRGPGDRPPRARRGPRRGAHARARAAAAGADARCGGRRRAARGRRGASRGPARRHERGAHGAARGAARRVRASGARRTPPAAPLLERAAGPQGVPDDEPAHAPGGVPGGARPGPPRRALGRRPARDHHVLDPRRRQRVHAAVGRDGVDGRARDLPRARGAHGHRHRSGAHRPHPPAIRRALDARRADRPARCQPRDPLRSVRRHRRRAGHGGRPPRHRRPGCGCGGLGARAARVVPARRARAARAQRRLRRVRHRRVPRPSRLAGGRPRPRRPDRARQP